MSNTYAHVQVFMAQIAGICQILQFQSDLGHKAFYTPVLISDTARGRARIVTGA